MWKWFKRRAPTATFDMASYEAQKEFERECRLAAIARLRKARKEQVEAYLLSGPLKGEPFCLDGVWSWCTLSDGKSLPQIDIVFPSYPLVVMVLGPESASWDEAFQLGVSRDCWERTQADLALFRQYVSEPTRPVPSLILEWGDSTEPAVLRERLAHLSDPSFQGALL